MRPIIFITFLLICFSSFGQISNLTGHWFSTDQDWMSFNKGSGGIPFQNSNMLYLWFEKEVEHGDTLNLYLMDGAIYPDKKFVFQTKDFTDSSFILKSVSTSARKIFNGRKQITFYRQDYFNDPDLQFEKLLYSKGHNRAGWSDSIALQVDNQKKLSFTFHSDSDTSINGNFVGTMTDKGYETLITLLKRVNLKKLFWPKAESDNGTESRQELIVYFNGQMKKLLSLDETPAITEDLLSFLANIKKYSTFHKTNNNLVSEN